MITLVKWIENRNKTSKNRIITRTLGKIGLMPSDVLFRGGNLPKKDEFWYSEIVCETKPGRNGVFVLRPIKKIEDVPHYRTKRPNFEYLIPGMFDMQRRRNALLIYPHQRSQHWICSSPMRTFLMRKHRDTDGQQYPVNAVIVVFDGASDWVTHGLPQTGAIVRPVPGNWTSAQQLRLSAEG